MKAATLSLLLFLPAAAAAQQASPAPADGQPSLSAEAPAASAQPPAQARPSDRKRRGSMVGYIDDATLESQIRVRFDAGFHNLRPDWAEFFYAKCGCYRQLAGNVAYDPNAAGPGPGIVSDLNFQQFVVQAQIAVKGRLALFAEIPTRWIQPQTFLAAGPPGTFGSQGGLGDVRGGVKVALVSTPDATLTAQVQGYFKTGDASKGLGTNHTSVEPALLYYQKIADRVAIESMVGDWHPINGSPGVPISSADKFAGDVFFYGIGPSIELVSTDRLTFAPVVELVGWRVPKAFETPEGKVEGVNVVNLKIGARTTVGGQSSFYVGYGRALTTDVWYNDILMFEYRFSF